MGASLVESDIEAYLAAHQRKEILRFLTAGSVDDGKSTLIGRLLHDSNMVYEDQLAALKKDSAKKSSAGGAIDYSLLVDGLLSEREQGITIDVAYRYFTTEKRKFIIADTPGHEEYTRNMATGASTADLVVILVDARLGVLPQTRRHSFIASLLGIRHVVVAVNKMDLCGFDEAVFAGIRRVYAEFADKLGTFASVHYLPVSALGGDNVVAKSASTPWYAGPPLLEYLETVDITARASDAPLRFPVQYVIRPDLEFRGFAGSLASGSVRVGDEVLGLPSRRTSKVRRIVTWDGDRDEASAPLAVTLTLADEIDLSRGDMLVHVGAEPKVGRAFDATVVWMQSAPLVSPSSYLLKHTTRLVAAEITRIHERTDVTTLETSAASSLSLNEIGKVTITTARPLLFDPYTAQRATGAFILIDRVTFATSGAGMILGPASEPRERAEGPVTEAERFARLGHAAAVIVVRGDRAAALPLALALERGLWSEGVTSHVLGVADLAALPLFQRLGVVTILCLEASDARLPSLERALEIDATASADVALEGARLYVRALSEAPSGTERAKAKAP